MPQDRFIRHRFVASELKTRGRHVGVYNGPITGKRREAWREGIEDVELFRHLRERAAKTGDAALRTMHDDGLKTVLKTQGHHGQNFGMVADLMALRAQILKTVSVRR